MTLLDRYIFRSVLGTCLAAVGVFAFILILGNALRDLLGLVLNGQLAYPVFARLLLLLVPFVISFALPMGMLTGVLLTLGRLSADSEITAMRAAGMSRRHIARPVLLLGLLGFATALYVNFESMPWARVAYHRELAAAVRANPLSFIVPRTFIRDFPGYVIYVGEKNGPTLRDFWLWKLDADRRVVQLVTAESGRFEYDEPSNILTLTLSRAMAEQRDEKAPENFGEAQRVPSFESYGPERLSLERLFGPQARGRNKIAWMTWHQLHEEEQRVAAEPYAPADQRDHERAVMKVKLTIQEKYTTALAVLTFAVIGVPLGIRVSRRETSANFGLAVALALGYYFLTVMVGWLDRHPEYRPDLLLWLPNLIFLGVGGWLFRRLERR